VGFDLQRGANFSGKNSKSNFIAPASKPGGLQLAAEAGQSPGDQEVPDV
jgi:hypothetical protein